MISSDPHLTAYIRVLLKEQRQNLAVGYFNKAVKHLAEYVLPVGNIACLYRIDHPLTDIHVLGAQMFIL